MTSIDSLVTAAFFNTSFLKWDSSKGQMGAHFQPLTIGAYTSCSASGFAVDSYSYNNGGGGGGGGGGGNIPEPGSLALLGLGLLGLAAAVSQPLSKPQL